MYWSPQHQLLINKTVCLYELKKSLTQFYYNYTTIISLLHVENLQGKPELVNLLKKEPRLHDIQECLSGMASKWRDLGTCLQVESGKLESLSRDTSMSDTTKLMDVVNEWDNSHCSPHTVEKLNDCLNTINQKKYTRMIEKMLESKRPYYSRQPDYTS